MLQNLRNPAKRRLLAAADPTRRWVSAIGFAVAVGIAYFLAARLSLSLLTKPDGVAVFWPASGVAAGALIALGPGARWPVAIGAMAATIVANLLGDRTFAGAITFGLCNVGEAMLTAGLIKRQFGSDFSLDRLRHVLGLLAAAVFGAAVSGVGGTLGFKLFHSSTAPSLTIWQHWFASDALGIVTVAPLLIGVAAAARDPPPQSEAIEGSMALMAITVTSAINIFLPRESWATVVPIGLLFPLLLWLAARCRPVFAAAAAFIVALTIVWTTTFGIGYFGDPDLPIADRILGAQAGILTTSLCTFVLAALFAERRQHEAGLSLLIAELDHRVKNVLARVAVVAMYTRQGSNTMDEFIEALDRRIQSMAVAHELLSLRHWQGVRVTDIVHRQLAPYATDANTTTGGPDITLTTAATEALAMVLQELVTNASKYGALSVPDGRVSVSWECRNSADHVATSLMIVWRETGGPPVSAPTQYGYGTSLICDLIPHELRGTVDLAFSSDGVCCTIEIPLKRR